MIVTLIQVEREFVGSCQHYLYIAKVFDDVVIIVFKTSLRMFYIFIWTLRVSRKCWEKEPHQQHELLLCTYKIHFTPIRQVIHGKTLTLQIVDLKFTLQVKLHPTNDRILELALMSWWSFRSNSMENVDKSLIITLLEVNHQID